MRLQNTGVSDETFSSNDYCCNSRVGGCSGARGRSWRRTQFQSDERGAVAIAAVEHTARLDARTVPNGTAQSGLRQLSEHARQLGVGAGLGV